MKKVQAGEEERSVEIQPNVPYGLDALASITGAGKAVIRGTDVSRIYKDKDGLVQEETLPVGYLNQDNEYTPYQHTKPVVAKSGLGLKGAGGTSEELIKPEEFTDLARKETTRSLEEKGAIAGAFQKFFQNPLKEEINSILQIITGKERKSVLDYTGREGGAYETGKAIGEGTRQFAKGIVTFAVAGGIGGAIKAGGELAGIIGATALQSGLENIGQVNTNRESVWDAAYNIGSQVAMTAIIPTEFKWASDNIIHPALAKAIASDSKLAFAVPLAKYFGTIAGVSAINTGINMAGSTISNALQGREIPKNMFEGFFTNWAKDAGQLLGFDLLSSTHRFKQGKESLEMQKKINTDDYRRAINYANCYADNPDRDGVIKNIQKVKPVNYSVLNDYLDNVSATNEYLSNLSGRKVSVGLDKDNKPYLNIHSSDPTIDRARYETLNNGDVDKQNEEVAKDKGIPKEAVPAKGFADRLKNAVEDESTYENEVRVTKTYKEISKAFGEAKDDMGWDENKETKDNVNTIIEDYENKTGKKVTPTPEEIKEMEEFYKKPEDVASDFIKENLGKEYLEEANTPIMDLISKKIRERLDETNQKKRDKLDDDIDQLKNWQTEKYETIRHVAEGTKIIKENRDKLPQEELGKLYEEQLGNEKKESKVKKDNAKIKAMAEPTIGEQQKIEAEQRRVKEERARLEERRKEIEKANAEKFKQSEEERSKAVEENKKNKVEEKVDTEKVKGDILNSLDKAKTPDEIASDTGHPIKNVLSTLTQLELGETIKKNKKGQYEKQEVTKGEPSKPPSKDLPEFKPVKTEVKEPPPPKSEVSPVETGGETKQGEEKGIPNRRKDKSGNIYNRAKEGIAKVVGKERDVNFAEGKGGTEKAKFALIEASDLQPSHNADGSINHNDFLSAQPKKMKQDRIEAIKKNANNLDYIQASEGATAYTGAPVVNTRGEVIQGNGRSAFIKEGYRIGKGEEYRNALLEDAERLGISKEEASKLKEPVLVRLAEVSDARAKELGAYDDTAPGTANASGLKIANVVQQLESKPEKIEGLFKLMFTEDVNDMGTLNKSINKNYENIVNYLRENGFLKGVSHEDLYRGGEANPDYVNDIAGVVQRLLLKGKTPEFENTYNQLPGQTIRPGIDKSVPYILSVKPDKTILAHVQDAMVMIKDWKDSKIPIFKNWLNQYDTEGKTPSDRYSKLTTAIVDKLVNAKTQTEIKKIFANYAKLIKGDEKDIFEPQKPLSRDEAVKKLFGVDYTDKDALMDANNWTSDDATNFDFSQYPTHKREAINKIIEDNQALGIQVVKDKINEYLKTGNVTSDNNTGTSTPPDNFTSTNKGGSGATSEGEGHYTSGDMKQAAEETKSPEFKSWFGDWEKGNLDKYKITKFWDDKLSPKENALRLSKLNILPQETRELLTKLYLQIPNDLKLENSAIKRIKYFLKEGYVRSEGSITRTDNPILIINKGNTLASTIHELTHAATMLKEFVLHTSFEGKLSKDEIDAFENLENIRQYINEYLKTNKSLVVPKEGIYYGLKDVGEFISELTSNTKFRNLLRTIPDKKEIIQPKGLIRSILNTAIEPIKRLLGLNKIKDNNILEYTWNYLDKLAGKSDNRGTTSEGEGHYTSGQAAEETKSPKFKSWFGDWEKGPNNASKINGKFIKEQFPEYLDHLKSINQDGKYDRFIYEIENNLPITILHGTVNDVESFKMKASSYNPTKFMRFDSPVIYGTQDIGYTNSFARDNAKHRGYENYSLENPIKYLKAMLNVNRVSAQEFADKYAKYERNNVMPLYFNIRNPYIVTEEVHTMGILSKMKLKMKGYDGVISIEKSAPDNEPRLVVIAFDPTQIKSAIGNRGTWDKTDPNITHAKAETQTIKVNGKDVEVRKLNEEAEIVDGFYSELENQIRDTKQNFSKQTISQWLTQLGSKGVKGEEIKWAGLESLKAQDPKKVFTKQELLDWIKKPENRVEVVEKVFGMTKKDAITKSIYEEIDRLKDENDSLLSLLDSTSGKNGQYYDYKKRINNNNIRMNRLFDQVADRPLMDITNLTKYGKNETLNLSGDYESRKEILILNPKGDFTHQHWEGERGVIAHLRLDIRKGADGKRETLLNEVQSDWGQGIKKYGITDSDISKYTAKNLHGDRWDIYKDGRRIHENMYGETSNDAINNYIEGSRHLVSSPFVTETPHWTKLALKVAIKDAVKEGVDRVAWTTGEQQNERYDLSKQVDKITTEKRPSNLPEGYFVKAYKNGAMVINKDVPLNELENTVGKEISQKIEQGQNVFEGIDLKVGGKGMREFYGEPDNNNLGIIGNIAKSLGGDIKTFDTENGKMHGFEITPKMKAEVQRGLPLFAKETQGKTFEVKPNNVKESLESIKSSDNPIESKIATKVSELIEELGADIKINVGEGTESFLDRTTNEITLPSKTTPKVFLHEILHRTTKAWNALGLSKKLSPEQQKIWNSEETFRLAAIKAKGLKPEEVEKIKYDDGNDAYYLKQEEFVNALHTSELQSYIGDIKWNPKETLIDKAKSYLKKVFGIKSNDTILGKAFDELMKVKASPEQTIKVNLDNPMETLYQQSQEHPDPKMRQLAKATYDMFYLLRKPFVAQISDMKSERGHVLYGMESTKRGFVGYLEPQMAPDEFLHEAGHVYHDVINKWLKGEETGKFKPILDNMELTRGSLIKTFKATPETMKVGGEHYFLHDLHEMVSELFNPEVKAHLEKLKVNPELTRWQQILNYVKQLFGVKPKDNTYDSILKKVLEITDIKREEEKLSSYRDDAKLSPEKKLEVNNADLRTADPSRLNEKLTEAYLSGDPDYQKIYDPNGILYTEKKDERMNLKSDLIKDKPTEKEIADAELRDRFNGYQRKMNGGAYQGVIRNPKDAWVVNNVTSALTRGQTEGGKAITELERTRSKMKSHVNDYEEALMAEVSRKLQTGIQKEEISKRFANNPANIADIMRDMQKGDTSNKYGNKLSDKRLKELSQTYFSEFRPMVDAKNLASQEADLLRSEGLNIKEMRQEIERLQDKLEDSNERLVDIDRQMGKGKDLKDLRNNIYREKLEDEVKLKRLLNKDKIIKESPEVHYTPIAKWRQGDRGFRIKVFDTDGGLKAMEAGSHNDTRKMYQSEKEANKAKEQWLSNRHKEEFREADWVKKYGTEAPELLKTGKWYMVDEIDPSTLKPVIENGKTKRVLVKAYDLDTRAARLGSGFNEEKMNDIKAQITGLKGLAGEEVAKKLQELKGAIKDAQEDFEKSDLDNDDMPYADVLHEISTELDREKIDKISEKVLDRITEMLTRRDGWNTKNLGVHGWEPESKAEYKAMLNDFYKNLPMRMRKNLTLGYANREISKNIEYGTKIGASDFVKGQEAFRDRISGAAYHISDDPTVKFFKRLGVGAQRYTLFKDIALNLWVGVRDLAFGIPSTVGNMKAAGFGTPTIVASMLGNMPKAIEQAILTTGLKVGAGNTYYKWAENPLKYDFVSKAMLAKHPDRFEVYNKALSDMILGKMTSSNMSYSDNIYSKAMNVMYAPVTIAHNVVKSQIAGISLMAEMMKNGSRYDIPKDFKGARRAEFVENKVRELIDRGVAQIAQTDPYFNQFVKGRYGQFLSAHGVNFLTTLLQPSINQLHSTVRMLGQVVKGNPDIPAARWHAATGLAMRSFLVTAMFGSSADLLVGLIQPALDLISKTGWFGDELMNLNDKIDRGIHDEVIKRGGNDQSAKDWVNVYHTSLLEVGSAKLLKELGLGDGNIGLDIRRTENPLLAMMTPQVIEMVHDGVDGIVKTMTKLNKDWGTSTMWNDITKIALDNTNSSAARLYKSAYQASIGKRIDAKLEETSRKYDWGDALRDNMMLKDINFTREQQTEYENKFKAYSDAQTRDTYYDLLTTPGLKFPEKDAVDKLMLKEADNLKSGQGDIRKLYYDVHDIFIKETEGINNAIEEFKKILESDKGNVTQRVEHISKKELVKGIKVDPSQIDRTNKELDKEEENLLKNVAKYYKAEVTAKALSEYTGTKIINALDEEMTVEGKKIKNEGSLEDKALAYAKLMLHNYLYGKKKKSVYDH